MRLRSQLALSGGLGVAGGAALVGGALFFSRGGSMAPLASGLATWLLLFFLLFFSLAEMPVMIVVMDDSEITLISAEGMVLRTRLKQISQMGRATRGAMLMRLKKRDTVAALALLAPRGKKKSAQQSEASVPETDGSGPGDEQSEP